VEAATSTRIVRCLVNPFKKFTIANVSKKLNEINFKISLSHQKSFPNLNFLSNYRFKKRFVKILPNGDNQGGYTKMITSLIDFSFTTSPKIMSTSYYPWFQNRWADLTTRKG
jgi:hypothetical protein